MRLIFDELAECVFVYCGDELILRISFTDLMTYYTTLRWTR